MFSLHLLPNDLPAGPKEPSESHTNSKKKTVRIRVSTEPLLCVAGVTGLGAGEMILPLRVEYDRLRALLETLLAQPVKDMAAVDRLVDELEQLQLRIKGELGIKGNNPNE